MVTQPGPIGWCYDSVILSLALPGCTNTKKALVLLGQDLKNVKLLISLLLLMLAICLKPGKQNTCSLVGTSASLAARDDVEHFVFMTARCDVLLSPCLLLGIVGWILLDSLPSVPADVEISGVQLRPSWSSVYTGHTPARCVNIFV